MPLPAGVESSLPKCHRLAGESQAEQVFAAATETPRGNRGSCQRRLNKTVLTRGPGRRRVSAWHR